MTDDEAFLQAILKNPDDDTPRLIYADWLDERGEPRGEFIRTQCRLATLCADDERRSILELRERALLKCHQDRWLGSLRPLLSGWTFHRGFLDAITVPAATFLQNPGFPRPATVRQVTADLKGFFFPLPVLDFVPESIARENVLIPLGFREQTLILAASNPLATDLLLKMQFIFNRDVELVAADLTQLIEAINHNYGRAEVDGELTEYLTDAVDESVITTCFIDPYFAFAIEDDELPIARLMALIVSEALAMSADQIRIEPRTEFIQVFNRIDQKWVERDNPPRRLLPRMVARIRHLANLASVEESVEQQGHISGASLGSRFDLAVHIRPTVEGPSVTLTFLAVS